jgi:hypothetical protein
MERSAANSPSKTDFAVFHRADGSAVACRLGQIVFVGKGENGATLNFNGGAQVNVHESFEEVLFVLGMDRFD